MEYPLHTNKSCHFSEFIKHMSAPGVNSAMRADTIREEGIKDFGLEKKDRNSKHDTTWVYFNHEVIKKKLADKEYKNEDEKDELEFKEESWAAAVEIVKTNNLDHFEWDARNMQPLMQDGEQKVTSLTGE